MSNQGDKPNQEDAPEDSVKKSLTQALQDIAVEGLDAKKQPTREDYLDALFAVRENIEARGLVPKKPTNPQKKQDPEEPTV